jgi:hypothetical protein
MKQSVSIDSINDFFPPTLAVMIVVDPELCQQSSLKN